MEKEFENYFISQVSTTSGDFMFVLYKSFLPFFEKMSRRFDECKFKEYCYYIGSMTGSDVLNSKIIGVKNWPIHNL